MLTVDYVNNIIFENIQYLMLNSDDKRVKDLAKVAHLSTSTIYKYREGKRTPSAAFMSIMADYYNVPVEAMYQKDGVKHLDEMKTKETICKDITAKAKAFDDYYERNAFLKSVAMTAIDLIVP